MDELMIASTISGNISADHRGQVSFVNDFNMEQVVRFYTVVNADTSIKRGWQGHHIEHKWFYCVLGAFSVHYIRIDDWNHPSPSLHIEKVILTDHQSEVLHIPGGYVTCIQSLSNDAKLMVFSNLKLEASQGDDYRFDINYWNL